MNPTTARIERTYFLAQALFWLSVSLPTALSVLLMQARGLDLLQVGALMGVYSLTVVLFEFPSGAMADAVGRKRIALLGYGTMLGAFVATLFAFTFAGFLLAWVLMGAGRAFASGALTAWFIDGLLGADPSADIQPPLARAGTFELLALALGTLGGGYLPALFPSLPEEGRALLTPLSVPLVGSIVMSALLIAFVALGVRDTHRQASREGMGLKRLPAVIGDAIRLARRNRTLLLLLAATLAGGFALAGLETFWQPHFAALFGGAEGKTPLFGVILAGCFFAGMLGNLASIRVSRWLGGRHALVAGLGLGLSGVALVALAFQGSAAAAAGLFWLVYLCRTVGLSPHAALVNGQVSREQRSTLLSFESLVAYAGFFTGSVALGYLAERVSTAAPWAVAGAVMAASVALYLQVAGRRRGVGDGPRPAAQTPMPVADPPVS